MPNRKRFTQQFPVLVTAAQHDWLLAEADRREVPAAQLVRDMIDKARRAKVPAQS